MHKQICKTCEAYSRPAQHSLETPEYRRVHVLRSQKVPLRVQWFYKGSIGFGVQGSMYSCSIHFGRKVVRITCFWRKHI